VRRSRCNDGWFPRNDPVGTGPRKQGIKQMCCLALLLESKVSYPQQELEVGQGLVERLYGARIRKAGAASAAQRTRFPMGRPLPGRGLPMYINALRCGKPHSGSGRGHVGRAGRLLNRR
jgi:hypothetical protein